MTGLFDPDTFEPSVKLARNARDTSRQAAESVLPHTGTARRRVFDALARFRDRGMTDEDLQRYLAMSPNSTRPRRIELVEQGLVIDSGERRPTDSGASAVVWKIRMDAVSGGAIAS